ncbi:hypothetical protein [Vulcanisaeta sp. JCM 16161]|uniref:hypothetical protein n=1 Tax=Vulcanisaeta sp. JCM 16161 TaxID=1295372 RepID=UPI0006D1FE3F|nr:hypothetical protein [Vulcanisaeta sp. JCM 16161]
MMIRLAWLIISVILILGVTSGAYLYAQSVGVSLNGSVNASSSAAVGVNGLEVSYKVHLLIAERWVTALNMSGINTTSVTQLISSAEAQASEGNYLSAIATLNAAINLAAQLMAKANLNSTYAALSNYEITVSNLNTAITGNLLNNETIANFTLKVLSASLRSNNTLYIINTALLMLSNEKNELSSGVSAGALAGLNTAIEILNNASNELASTCVSSNITARSMTVLKAEILTAALLVPTRIRVKLLTSIMAPELASLNSTASITIQRLSLELNTTLTPQPLLGQCAAEINEALNALASANLTPPEAEVRVNELMSIYGYCLAQTNALANITEKTHAVLSGFVNINNELASEA